MSRLCFLRSSMLSLPRLGYCVPFVSRPFSFISSGFHVFSLHLLYSVCFHLSSSMHTLFFFYLPYQPSPPVSRIHLNISICFSFLLFLLFFPSPLFPSAFSMSVSNCLCLPSLPASSPLPHHSYFPIPVSPSLPPLPVLCSLSVFLLGS